MRPSRLVRDLQRPDTEAAVAERLRYARIAAQVAREVSERFPTITAENAAEVIAWQSRRITELQKETT